MCPNLPTINAASPETCGVAIDVPVAKKVEVISSLFPAGAQHKIKHKAASGYRRNVTYRTLGSKDAIATHACLRHRPTTVAHTLTRS